MKKLLAFVFAVGLVTAAYAQFVPYSSPRFQDVTIDGNLTLNGFLGKFKAKGSAPAIDACGTGSPSVAGTDNAMLLTMGTGTLTQCTVTFATPWPIAPHCVAFPANTTAAATGTTGAYIDTPTTSVLTFKGSNLTSAAYQVLCW